VTPAGLVTAISAMVAARPGRVRLAVDGAPAADPGRIADEIITALSPRTALHVRAETFWRPAGVRLEQGRHNSDSWLDGWLDADALRREVLEPFPTTGRCLPALRDPVTDRSARAVAVFLPPGSVIVVSGHGLIGRGLTFDVTVHLHLSPSALARRTPADQAWTLPALARYCADDEPERLADLVARVDDPRHPALVLRA
jgi:hypothetical protein